MTTYELDGIEKEALPDSVLSRARADLNDGKPLTEMRRKSQPDLLTAAQHLLDKVFNDGKQPTGWIQVQAEAVKELAEAVGDYQVNSDPEAKIEQMVHELAYERVKHSYLFNQLGNEIVDRKADELAAEIAALVEKWIVDAVTAECSREQ